MSGCGRRVSALMIAALCCGASACTVRHGDFTVLSDKLVKTSDFDLDTADRTKGVTGEEIAQIIILFPTVANPTLKGAIDDALKKGKGDVMTDAVIEFEYWYIPFIYGRTGWRVTGDVVRTRK